MLPSAQMAKCENCGQSSVQVRESETGVEKVNRKMASTHRLSSVCKARFRSFHIVCRCVFCILRFQSVLASVFADSNCYALVLSSMSYDQKMNSVFTCIFT